jgi:hypothetical protein
MRYRDLAYVVSLLLVAGSVGCPPPDPPTPPGGQDLRELDLRPTSSEVDLLNEEDMRPPPQCMQSSECPSGMPICDQDAKKCRPCTGNPECAGRGGDTKVCNAGSCVECVSEVDCGASAGLACVANRCLPCGMHDVCESKVCDVYEKNGKGSAGRCLQPGEVVYVDNKNGSCAGAHAGSLADPACSIADGLGKLVAGKTSIRVFASTKDYGQVSVSRSVALYGPAKLGNDANKDAVTVSGTAKVTLDGFEITTGKVGVSCSGTSATQLALRRSQVLLSTGTGISSAGCALSLDRMMLRGNKDGALALAGTSYAITNSFIIANSSPANAAIRINNSSTGTFQFNTVAGNVSSVAAGISCGQLARDIENSIFANNTAVSSSQLFGSCTLKDTVVGMGDSAPGGITKDPEFVNPAPAVSDYHLKDTAKNADCCINKAHSIPAVTVDYDGKTRGMMQDIGAHEVR